MKQKIGTYLLLAMGLLATLGFRVYPGGNKWRVDSASPKIWIQFSTRPTVIKNDFKEGDALYGQSLSFDVVTQGVLTDYNSVTTSFLRLYDAATDGTFASADSANRIIKIDFVVPQAGDGQALRTTENGLVKECLIKVKPDLADTARGLTWVLTHEIGHCLGLDHPQETVYAAMSYFGDHSYPRLQMDDKMGLTYLYPTNPDAAVESATFGLSCAPKK